MIRTHMHRQEPSFVDRFTGYAETAGKVYGAAQTLYHVGRAVGQCRALCCTPFSPSVKEECVHSTRQCGRFGITPAMRTQPLGTTPSGSTRA